MKLGLRYLNQAGCSAPSFMAEIASAAEEAGFESLWVSDHVVVPTAVGSECDAAAFARRISGHVDGRVYLDPFACLAHLAAATRTINLATAVIVLPLRHPLLVAKAAATVDFLSEGRFMLGIGAGWLREEFAALGVDFAQRFRVMDEHVDAIRSSWELEPSEFSGEYSRWSDVAALPRPPHRRIRLIVGGEGPASARRAMAYGDGYFPTGGQAQLRIDQLRHGLERTNRDPEAVEVTLGATSAPLPTAGSGCHRIVLPVRRDTDAGPFTVRRPEDVESVHNRVAELVGD